MDLSIKLHYYHWIKFPSTKRKTTNREKDNFRGSAAISGEHRWAGSLDVAHKNIFSSCNQVEYDVPM